MSKGGEGSGGVSSGTLKLAPPARAAPPPPFSVNQVSLEHSRAPLVSCPRLLGCFEGRVQKLQERPHGRRAKDTDRLALPRKRSPTSAGDRAFPAAARPALGAGGFLVIVGGRGVLSCVL